MMAKKISVLFLLFFPGLVFAQSFNAGARIGIIASQVDGDTYEGFNKPGLTLGVYVSRKISDPFSMQFEMNFIQKGSRKPVDEFNRTYYLMRLSYIEVPLMIQWHASKSIDIFAGPSFGVLLNSYEETEAGEFTGPEFEKYEVAGRIGLGYKLSEQWTVDARYSISLATIRPSPAGYTPFMENGQYNRLIEIGFSYQF